MIKLFEKSPFPQSSIIEPMYRAANSFNLQSRSKSGALYFANTPRVNEFGKFVTKAYLDVRKPFTFRDDHIDTIVGSLRSEVLNDLLYLYGVRGVNTEDWELSYKAISDAIKNEHTLHDNEDLLLTISKHPFFDSVISRDYMGGSSEIIVFSPKQVFVIEQYKA